LEDTQIWLGLHGQRFGPYALETVRRWHRQGMLDSASLCWRDGMSEWLPLETFLREQPAGHATYAEPPSLEVPPPGLTPRATSVLADAPRPNDAPVAPSLHWGWVALLTIVTLGIFAVVWMFVQSTWVKKIDPRSNATVYFVIALVCGFAGGFIGGNSPLPVGLQVVDVVFIYMGYYAMSASLKRFGAERGLPMEIGGVTLFFFTTWYLQGQLSRIARWQQTGVIEEAPKGIFWAIYGVLMGLLVLGIVVAVRLFS
jgi:hypothetical protein